MNENFIRPLENTSEGYKKYLRSLGQKLLDEGGQEALGEHLDTDDTKSAEALLLGAIDSSVFDKKISDEEARVYYGMLGVDTERTIRLRQSNKDLWNSD